MSNKWKKRRMKIRGFFNWLFSVLLLRYAPRRAEYLKRSFSQMNIDKLHVGCGDIFIPGWLNIYYERREEYGRIKFVREIPTLNYNLLKLWPFGDETIRFIAGSHFIEHLELSDAILFFKECYRVLKKGGIVRLSCPDLETYAKNYVVNNQNFFREKEIVEGCCYKDAKTHGEIFIAKAYDSGNAHKWFYDFESLAHVAKVAGFSDAKRIKRLEGACPDLDKLEPPQREIESLYMEAIK